MHHQLNVGENADGRYVRDKGHFELESSCILVVSRNDDNT
jgi:hypothetical protein